MNFNNALDSVLISELSKTTLKDNYKRPVTIFFIFVPILLGIVAFIFDWMTVYSMVNQSINGWIGDIVGAIVATIAAATIFLLVSEGTLRSSKEFRLFVMAKKENKEYKRLLYSFMFMGLSIVGLVGTLEISDYADFLVSVAVPAKSVSDISKELNEIETQQEERTRYKENKIEQRKSSLQRELSVKIAGNEDASAAQKSLFAAIRDSAKAIAAQNRTIQEKQEAINEKTVSAALATGYQKDIDYRKNTVIPKLEKKHHTKIEKRRRALNLSTKNEKKWYSTELSKLNKKSTAIINSSDSTINWLIGLYKNETEQEFKNIEILSFFAKGGNKFINGFVFLSYFLLGFFIIPDFGKQMDKLKVTGNKRKQKETKDYEVHNKLNVKEKTENKKETKQEETKGNKGKQDDGKYINYKGKMYEKKRVKTMLNTNKKRKAEAETKVNQLKGEWDKLNERLDPVSKIIESSDSQNEIETAKKMKEELETKMNKVSYDIRKKEKTIETNRRNIEIFESLLV